MIETIFLGIILTFFLGFYNFVNIKSKKVYPKVLYYIDQVNKCETLEELNLIVSEVKYLDTDWTFPHVSLKNNELVIYCVNKKFELVIKQLDEVINNIKLK